MSPRPTAPGPADPDAYTELDATFQSPPTQKQPWSGGAEPAPGIVN